MDFIIAPFNSAPLRTRDSLPHFTYAIIDKAKDKDGVTQSVLGSDDSPRILFLRDVVRVILMFIQ